MNTLGRQRGLSIWELLFFSILVGATAIVVIKLLPLYMEKFKVVKAMKSIAEEPEARNFDDQEIVSGCLDILKLKTWIDLAIRTISKKSLALKKTKTMPAAPCI
ncbi:MAG: hypothetical protein U1F34_03640 [Gammaproteobacteria bacterium]